MTHLIFKLSYFCVTGVANLLCELISASSIRFPLFLSSVQEFTVTVRDSCSQGCGSGSGLDPDPDWIRIQRLCVSGSGSRGKKTKKVQWKKCTFWLFLKKSGSVINQSGSTTLLVAPFTKISCLSL
jgi:hypothetical protein